MSNCPLDTELDNSNTDASIDAIVLAKCNNKVIFEVSSTNPTFGQIILVRPFDFAERFDFSIITASALTGKEESNTAIVFQIW